MTSAGGLDGLWHAAIESALDDPQGEDIRRTQGLWALAVRAETGADVRCGGDVFGPALTPGGFVVMRPAVAVRGAVVHRTFEACQVAWRRWAQVDEFGVEATAAEREEDPDPFGYPHLDDGWVWLAFDAREDEEPYPHRALTCLRILLQELRAYGCTPAQVVNPLHLPDDEGVDVADLAAQAAGAATSAGTTAADTQPRAPKRPPVPGAGPRLPRPAWLPAFREVVKARPGRPTGPVPFVLLAAGRVMAWDPTRGLLRLPDPEPGSAVLASVGLRDLSADGTRLHCSLGHLDLGSGAVMVEPTGAGEVFRAPVGGRQLRVEGPPRGSAPADLHDRYTLLDPAGAGELDLPLRDLLASVGGGPAAQFSPSGRLLLTSHTRAVDSCRYVTCTDLSTGQAREYTDTQLVGTASWSPDETRLLVMRGNQPYVLDLASGHSTFVHMYPIEDDEPAGPMLWSALGFLDDHGLVVTKRYGRRLRLAYQPVDNSSRHMILDIPVSATQGNTLGIALAPALLRTSPHLIGYHPQ